MENIAPIATGSSALSGQPVAFASDDGHVPGRLMALDETSQMPSFPPLELDAIKDLDSLLQAVSERAYYAGDVVLGRSMHVSSSSDISDSFYVLGSAWVDDSKYMAYVTRARHSEDCFGCHMAGESASLIYTNGDYRNKRCLGLWQGQNSSDCYYSHRLEGCNECFFCFNLYSARYCIGNLPLEKSQYFGIKDSLLAQIADELEQKKRLPSLLELLGPLPSTQPPPSARQAEPPQNPSHIKKEINTAFSLTCKMLLGRPLEGDIGAHEKWLTHGVLQPLPAASALSKKPIRLMRFANYDKLPANRLLTLAEGAAHGRENKIDGQAAGALTLANAGSMLSPIAFFTPEFVEGTNTDILDCAASVDSSMCYRMAAPPVATKYAAFTYWARRCEYVFGGSTLFDCRFALACRHCVSLTRCLGTDSSRSSSDCHFCHNVEDCAECLFCFNVKGKRYAIGNVEMKKEDYLRVKKMVMVEVAALLEKEKKLPEIKMKNQI